MPTPADNQAQIAITEALQPLYAAKLYQPEVWQNLQNQHHALQRSFLWAQLSVAALLAAVLWAFGLGVWAALLMVAVLVFIVRQRAARAKASQRLAHLLQPPAALFSSVAVNKIVMEVCERAPEAAAYMAKVQAGGRHVIGGFELQQLLRVLAVLDAQKA